MQLIDTVGPTHPVTLSDGTLVHARSHTHTVYDENAPNGDVSPHNTPYRLPTTITTAAQTADGVDHDVRTVQKGYAPVLQSDNGVSDGWTLRMPTTVTTVMTDGSPNLVTTTRYDAQGHIIEGRMPSDPGGTTAGTTLSTYWSSAGDGSGNCASASEAGLLCMTKPYAQPTSGLPAIPTTTTNYDLWGNPTTVVEMSGNATRTTTTIYDGAERACIRSVQTSGVGDTALPATYTGYDRNTGLVTLVGNISGTVPSSCPSSAPTLGSQISSTFDSDGRLHTYTDTGGNLATTGYNADGQVASLNDGKSTVSYSYDDATDHDGKLVSLTDGQAGTFSGTYSADGALVSEQFPSGLVASRHYNDAGQATALVYTMTSTPWLSFSAAYSAQGQIVSQSGTKAGGVGVSSQVFSYDAAGRLTKVADTDNTVSPSVCTTRVYSYDADSNRLSLAAYPQDAGGNCSTNTNPTTSNHLYDQADRISSSGYSYDALGRTTALPAVDAGGSNLSLGYWSNDMVQSETQGATTKTFGLDPAERIATITTSGAVQTSYFGDGGDSPVWIASPAGSWTRNVEDVAGNLAAVVSVNSSGSITGDELQLVNLHGDVVATTPNSSSASGTDAYFESTEFGVARASNASSPRYAWLGGARRDSGDDLGGLVLMGQRLYSPSLGRFLQVDPVAGSSANDYDYCHQDPVNARDLSGQWPSFLGGAWHWFKKHARKIGLIASTISMACGVASVAIVDAPLTGACSLIAGAIAMAADCANGCSKEQFALDLIGIIPVGAAIGRIGDVALRLGTGARLAGAVSAIRNPGRAIALASQARRWFGAERGIRTFGRFTDRAAMTYGVATWTRGTVDYYNGRS